MKIEFLKGINDLKELKATYRKLAMEFHPDKATGSVEKMQKLNAEYEYLNKRFENNGQEFECSEETEEFFRIINELTKIFEGKEKYTVELKGTWFWIWGIEKDDKEIIEEIKKLKFFWNKEKNVWRRKPLGDTKRRRKSMTMDEINARFETKTIKQGNKSTKQYKEIA